MMCVNYKNKSLRDVAHSALDALKCPVLRKAYSAEATFQDF